jgi:hypothetical protein
MVSHADAHHTLPSVIASIEEENGKQDLFITIAFHPDTSRIGSHANLGSMRGEKPRIVGRKTPSFGLGESAEIPLDDLYISREALRLCHANGAVTL